MDSKTNPKNVIINDEEIIERIIKGEKNLFENLIHKYNQRLYRIGMSIINDHNEVQDIMQTAYLNAYLHLLDFKKESGFSTWLMRIMINESLLRKKKMKKQQQVIKANSNATHQETPLNSLINKDLKIVLEKAVSELPEKYRLAFVLREIEGLNIKETMEVLNLSESNVKVRVSRAKKMLRDSLPDYFKSIEIFDLDLIECDKIIKAVMYYSTYNKTL